MFHRTLSNTIKLKPNKPNSTNKSITTTTMNTSNKIIVRIVTINDVYELHNLPRLKTLIQSLTNPIPSAIVLAGDFLSPSTLSSIDGGRGMVSVLRAVGVTHASLGNHEADVSLKVLRERVQQMGKKSSTKHYKGPITMLNSNVIPSKSQIIKDSEKYNWMTKDMKPYDIVTSHCGRIKIGLLGLLSDEDDMFRDGTFKGVPIRKVSQQWDAIKYQINNPATSHDFKGVHALIPMTHQSLAHDRILARHMVRTGTGTNHLHQKQNQPAVIIGGHEHEPYLEVVRGGRSRMSHTVQIVKTGQDADRAAVVDLIFDEKKSNNPGSLSLSLIGEESASEGEVLHSLDKIHVEFIDVEHYKESEEVKYHTDKHLKVIKDLETTNIINPNLLPQIFAKHSDSKNAPDSQLQHFNHPDFILSSKRTRFQQTTVGALFCQIIKTELEVDVCILNGAPIKGDSEYPEQTMSYSQLKTELPFPLKIVVVPMTRKTLQKAIQYSRLSVNHVKIPNDKPDKMDFQYEEIERRGYLQTDYDYMMADQEQTNNHKQKRKRGNINKNEVLSVALPRNLMSGFCNIQPLMDLGDHLKETNQFPSKDDYMKAIDIIVRYCCKERWVSLFAASHENFTAEDLEMIVDGAPLKREDVKKLLTTVMGEEPSDFLLEDMMNVLDEDESGTIDDFELRKILQAAKERKEETFA